MSGIRDRAILAAEALADLEELTPHAIERIVDVALAAVGSVEQASSEAKGPSQGSRPTPSPVAPTAEAVRSAAPAEQTSHPGSYEGGFKPPHDYYALGPWIVYEANGGTDGKGDRVYGPYARFKIADQVAQHINDFPQEFGRAWVLPLRPPTEAP